MNAAQRALVASLAMLMPVVLFFAAAAWNVEAIDTRMRAWMTTDGYTTSAFGRAVMIALILLLPAAMAVAAAPTLRKGPEGTRTIYPMNLLLAGMIAAALVLFGGAIVIDQLPCWRGVANCD